MNEASQGYGNIPTPPVPPYPQVAEAAPGPDKRALTTAGAVLGVLFLMVIGVSLGGEPAQFMSIGAQVMPLALLALMAYSGRKNSTMAVFTYIVLGLLGVLTVGLMLLLTIEPFLKLSEPTQVVRGSLLKPGAGPVFLWTVLLLMLAGALASSMLLRPVRAAVARVIPIDPDNFVHKIALSILTLIMLSAFVPLIVLGGRPPLLEVVNNPDFQSATQGKDLSRPVDLFYQFVWTIPAALLAAGWPVARKFRETLVRLGIVRPTLLQVVGGVAFGLLLAYVASTFIDPGINAIWKSMGWPTTDTGAFETLMKGLKNPLGAVLVGVTAGIGEEMAVRGLLQPRLGLILSNLIFTSFHALQYGPDGLLSVFIIGSMLGLVRMRTNTTTSAIVHGVYDFALVMAWVLASG